MGYIKLFEDYIPFEETKNKPSAQISTPEEIKPEEKIGYPYPEELDYWGPKGKAFYDQILSPHDGPVDEFVLIRRAFEWALAKKTPDGTVTYTIKNPVISQEVDMYANIFEVALKELKENGGKINSSEPVGRYE